MKLIKYIALLMLLIPTTAMAQAIGYGGISGGGNGVSVSTDCSTYTAIGRLCQDSDDGKLYKGTGAAVVEIAAGASGTVDVSGTPTNHQWPGWTDEDTLKGFTVTASKPVCSDASGDPAVCAGTEGVWQTAITFGTGTETALASAPDASGGLLSVAGLGSVTQAYNATLTALAAQTESQGALQYYTADATPAVLAKGTAYQLLQMNSGATAPEWTSSLSISALNLTSATSSIPSTVTTSTGAQTAAGQQHFESDTYIWSIGDGDATPISLDFAKDAVYTFPAATATLASQGTLTNTKWCTSDGTVINCTEDAPAGSGDVTDVGNCSGGNCLDGTSDGGTQILFYDAQGATTLAVGDNSGAVTITLPTTTGTLSLLGANTFTASQTITGDVLPEAANTRAIGSATAEWADIYLGDGAIIYGQNDQSNTITSSATGWSFAKPITIADVSNDNYIKVTNNTSRAATASVNEIYPEGNIWKVNQNGTESSLPIGPTAGQITFSGPTAARTVTLPDAAVTIPANPIGGTLGATTNVIPKANGTGTATLQASGITEDGTNVSIGSLNLVATGNISGKVPMISKSGNYTLGTDSAQEAYGYMVWLTGDGTTLTLPAVAAGMSVCVYSADSYDKVVDPNSSDGIRNATTTRNADGHSITSGATDQGSFVCLIADSADGWTVLGKAGTWTDE